MLVLSRREGEEIVIGESIRVKIVSVQKRRVKLAISAPKEVPVHRMELAQRMQSCSCFSTTTAK
jgi:carbon storage regulator